MCTVAQRGRLSKYKGLLLCSGGVLRDHRAVDTNRLIKGLRPHHEGLELCMSVVAKVVSKGWCSVTLSPLY